MKLLGKMLVGFVLQKRPKNGGKNTRIPLREGGFLPERTQNTALDGFETGMFKTMGRPSSPKRRRDILRRERYGGQVRFGASGREGNRETVPVPKYWIRRVCSTAGRRRREGRSRCKKGIGCDWVNQMAAGTARTSGRIRKDLPTQRNKRGRSLHGLDGVADWSRTNALTSRISPTLPSPRIAAQQGLGPAGTSLPSL